MATLGACFYAKALAPPSFSSATVYASSVASARCLKNATRSFSRSLLGFLPLSQPSCPPARSYVPTKEPVKAHMPIALGSEPDRIPATKPAAQPPAAPATPLSLDSIRLATVLST